MNPYHGVSVSISPLGDRALSISASVSAEKTLWLIMADLAHRIRAANQTWIIDVVPAYETVTVVYDPLALLQTRNGEGMNEEEKFFLMRRQRPISVHCLFIIRETSR